MKGSPEYSAGQKQTGTWLITSHCELTPQAPAHGLAHLLLMQALLSGHSVLRTHSGRQANHGFPKKPGLQVQEYVLFACLQIAFEPH